MAIPALLSANKNGHKQSFQRADMSCEQCLAQTVTDHYTYVSFPICDCSELLQSSSIFFLHLEFLLREWFRTAHKLLTTALGRQIRDQQMHNFAEMKQRNKTRLFHKTAGNWYSCVKHWAVECFRLFALQIANTEINLCLTFNPLDLKYESLIAFKNGVHSYLTTLQNR